MTIAFKKAVKSQSNLRMAIAGPSGSGKTFTALVIGTALADALHTRIAVIDTERGSAAKYSDRFDFDVLELDAPFTPDRYVEAITAAADAGYGVLVIDSLTHAWNGTGGLLEIVEQIAKRNKGGNSYAAWADATPMQNRLIDAITRARLHVIATIRSKQDHVQEKDDRGRTVIRKVGLAPVQREGMEYEFDIFADIDMDHNLLVQKSRCEALTDAVIAKPGPSVAQTLLTWLQTGEPVQVAAATPIATVPATASMMAHSAATRAAKPVAAPAASPARSNKQVREDAMRDLHLTAEQYTHLFVSVAGRKSAQNYTAMDTAYVERDIELRRRALELGMGYDEYNAWRTGLTGNDYAATGKPYSDEDMALLDSELSEMLGAPEPVEA